MALSAVPVMLRHDFDGQGGVVAPASLRAQWHTVIEAGRIAGTADAAAITNPLTEITDAKSRIFRKHRGTLVAARILHQGTGTLTSPDVVLFGRNSAVAGCGWRRLYNVATTPYYAVSLTVVAVSDITETFSGSPGSATNPYGVTQGSYQASDVTKDQVWDCMECDEFLFGIQTSFNATTGTEATAVVQACCF